MGFYDRVLVDKKRGRKRTENGRGDWNFDWKMDEKMDGLEEFWWILMIFCLIFCCERWSIFQFTLGPNLVFSVPSQRTGGFWCLKHVAQGVKSFSGAHFHVYLLIPIYSDLFRWFSSEFLYYQTTPTFSQGCFILTGYRGRHGSPMPRIPTPQGYIQRARQGAERGRLRTPLGLIATSHQMTSLCHLFWGHFYDDGGDDDWW